MRAKGISIQQLLLGLALFAALCWNLAHASEINHLRLNAGATGTRAEISVDREVEYTILSLANPDRLVVDLPGVALAAGLDSPPATGLVKAVRTGHPVPGTTRVVFDLAAPVVALKPRFEHGPDGIRLVLEWPGDQGGDPIARIAAATQDRATSPPPSAAQAQAAPQPQLDPAIASAAATSRLVASTVQSNPASTPTPQAMPTVTQAPGTIATGVPTHIATGTPAPVKPQAQPPANPPPTPLVRRSSMRPLIIAIDPGHGGQDPGAIGKNGTREKDVVLAISKELARQINATPGLNAYLTRDTDVFIPLNKRARLARAAKADMFISIHADAAENRSADGSSVYVLSLRGASSQRARWLADKENASDMIGGVRLEQASNTLATVLIDLTQSGHMKASEDAAEGILAGLGRVGNVHKSTIERANFAVLRTSDMPAMLVETAFISNPEEERRLQSSAFQRKIAGAVLDGVNTYFTRQPPPGTLYAARASMGYSSGGAVGGGSP